MTYTPRCGAVMTYTPRCGWKGCQSSPEPGRTFCQTHHEQAKAHVGRCLDCGHHHRGGRPNNSRVCDVQISHAGADADTDRYCKCPRPTEQLATDRDMDRPWPNVVRGSVVGRKRWVVV